MKKFLMFLCALTLVFGMVGVASAVPYTWTDIEDPDNDIYFSRGGVQSYRFTHDINDKGFNPGEDLVSTYDIRMRLYDDGRDGREWAYINLPGLWSDRIVEINYSDINLGMSFAGLIQLNTMGLLDVSLHRLRGEFYFVDSTLSAHGNESGAAAAPVPEPSTILLMGTGILGLVAYGRKRFNNKA